MGKKITIMQNCPRCGSSKTGKILPQTSFTYKKQMYDTQKILLNGMYVKYADPNRYRDYYRDFGINAFCQDCEYEFKGKISVITDKEKIPEIMRNKNIYNELSMYKKLGLFSRLKNMVQRRF